MTSHSTTTKANRPLAPMPPTPPTLAPPPQSPNPKETIKAVIIRCPSTAQPLDNNNTSTTNRIYQPLPIAPLETALHLSDTPLSIPSLVDLPLWMRSHAWTGPHGAQRKPQREQELENTIARPLCFVADPGSPNFGHAPTVRGDRLVGRMDGRDLSCRHLGCLVSFAEAVVREFGREMEGLEGKGRGRGRGARLRGREGGDAEGLVRERVARFRRLVCREEFRAYWVRWCGGDVMRRDWLKMKGPYDV